VHFYLFKTHYKYYGAHPSAAQFQKMLPVVAPTGKQALANLTSKPDAVFLGVYTWNKRLCHEFINELLHHYPSTPVFLGGPEVDLYNQEELLAFENIKGLVQGEGEVPLTLIVDAVVEQKPFDDIPGLWIRKENQFVKPTVDAPRISFAGGKGAKGNSFFEVTYNVLLENIDEILIDMSIHKQLNLWPTKQLTFWLELSRGCPYGCVYCDWGGGIEQKVRRRPHEEYKKEIELIVKHWDSVFVTDANFGIFPEDIEVSQLFVDQVNKLDKKFYMGYNIAKNNQGNVTKILEITKQLTPPGNIIVPIQSADEQTLKIIKRKQISGPQLYDMYSKSLIGENFQTQIITGLPGTTYDVEMKGIFEAYNKNINTKPTLCLVMPQAPMADPEFLKKWEIETFSTGHYLSVFNEENDEGSGFAVRYVKSCKNFSSDDLTKTFLSIEFLKLFEESWVTKFAKQLAISNGYSSKDFYEPLLNKFFNDTDWFNGYVEKFHNSFYSWYNENQPYGKVDDSFISEILIELAMKKYQHGQLKEEILDMVGHMHPLMGQALDLGFFTLPYPEKIKKLELNFLLNDGIIVPHESKHAFWLLRDPYTKNKNTEALQLKMSIDRINKRIFTDKTQVEQYLRELSSSRKMLMQSTQVISLTNKFAF